LGKATSSDLATSAMLSASLFENIMLIPSFWLSGISAML
jgi:hypothetical protein